jgi:Mlc titration factor MtfA (ptsG expression regulator)
MKTDSGEPAWFAPAIGAVLGAAGVTTGALLGASPGAAVGGLLGIGIALLLARGLGRRGRRRREVLRRRFPDAWRQILFERYDHYVRLPPELRARFEGDLAIFLAEQRITGIGVVVTDELRVLVAASAVTLSLGWPEYEWSHLTEVLLYPEDFDRDYSTEGDSDLAGQAHPWGTVILSVPTLQESFDDPDDGYHVGLHEFAHILDVDQTHFDGIPVGLPAARTQEWVALMQSEMERLRKGKSALDPYGAEDPVEFLAVAVEAFFEMPLVLRARHREVYAILGGYFGQDPAAWDDVRGLEL